MRLEMENRQIGNTPPLSAGFCTEHSAKARGIGYELERSPTLRAGVTPAVMIEVSNGRCEKTD